MKFSPEFVDKVREANNISDIISQYTTFSHKGHNLMGLCPFPDHREKTPSFSVSDTKQVYYCFGCKKSGNIINFLMEYNGMSFVEAVEYLAQRASIALPEENQGPRANFTNEKQKLTKLNLYAGGFFKKTFQDLPSTHPAKEYLKKRGLTDEVIETFKIGFSPDEWGGLTNYLTSKGAPLQAAQSLGLIKQKPFKAEYYDLFRNRIMYPILSPKGDVVGFGGRTITDENPKYLNSPESPLFHKGKILYGLNEAAKYIRIEDSVIVVEGYMDLIALYQYGFKNVVASMGTALTQDHAKLLKRFTKNVFVLFDSDQAGQFAQERSLPILLSEELLPKGIDLGDKKDPDEFLHALGAEVFKQKMQSATDLFFIIWRRILKGFTTQSPADKIQRLDAVAPYLMSVQDLALRDLYISEIASQLSVEKVWVEKTLRSHKAHAPVQQQRSVGEVEPASTNVSFEKIKIKDPYKEEVFLVNLALSSEKLMLELMEWGLAEKLTPSGLDIVFKKAVEGYLQSKASGTPNFDTLTSNLCSLVEDPSYITKFMDQSWQNNLNLEKLKADCLQRFNERSLGQEAKSLLNELKAESDPKKLEQFMNVIRNRQTLRQVKE